ncbi:DUF1937 family protein [Desulfovibrio sp. OttesenSCG-928-C14]|nr:DUF1937 family protein [Desulfovibrio sp. OttesenSCG-928-C14]
MSGTSERQMPRDLRAYQRVEPPKFKKDWDGKLIQVTRMPQRRGYNKDFKLCEGPDGLVPDGAVLQLYRRYIDYNKRPTLACRWPCPCCGHSHERDLPETIITEGAAHFVEESIGPGLPVPGGPNRVYLACPYSHDDPAVREARWLASSRAAAWLMLFGDVWFPNEGVSVLSPLSMGHPVSVMGRLLGLEYSFATWGESCLAMLEGCTHLVLLQLPGWATSIGCKAEVDHARKLGLAVLAMREDGADYTLDYLGGDWPGQEQKEGKSDGKDL